MAAERKPFPTVTLAAQRATARIVRNWQPQETAGNCKKLTTARNCREAHGHNEKTDDRQKIQGAGNHMGLRRETGDRLETATKQQVASRKDSPRNWHSHGIRHGTGKHIYIWPQMAIGR
eukprot:12489436-Alexandrium_andersonii.AAC.1